MKRADLRRELFEDRAISGLHDGYTEAEQRVFCDALLSKLGGIAAEEQSLRTRLDLLLLHSMMLRGESNRHVQFADLCRMILDIEGSNCHAVILQMTSGKKIKKQDGGNNRKVQYTGVLRTKDVSLCPVGALAMWFVFRWDVFGEKPPDFHDRSSWYNTAVIPGNLRRKTTPVNSSTQARWFTKAFQSAGVQSTKLTHAPRKTVARKLNALEVPDGDVSVLYIVTMYS